MKFVSFLKIYSRKKTFFSPLIFLRTTFFILFLSFLPGCGKQTPENNFNSAAWKADPYGCKGERKILLPELEKMRGELAGTTFRDAKELFGYPEANSLTDKNENIYTYYVEPGSQCQDKSRLSGANKLLVTVNGLGFVKEVRFEVPVKK